MLALFSLSNCGTPGTPVDVPDVTLYFQKGNPGLPDSFPKYILEEHFLTSGQADIDKDGWDLISQGKVSMSLEDWDKFNILVSQACSQLTCDYKTVQRLSELSAHFHNSIQK